MPLPTVIATAAEELTEYDRDGVKYRAVTVAGTYPKTFANGLLKGFRIATGSAEDPGDNHWFGTLATIKGVGFPNQSAMDEATVTAGAMVSAIFTFDGTDYTYTGLQSSTPFLSSLPSAADRQLIVQELAAGQQYLFDLADGSYSLEPDGGATGLLIGPRTGSAGASEEQINASVQQYLIDAGLLTGDVFTAVSDTITTQIDTEVNINVLANDTPGDFPPDPATVTIPPAGGTNGPALGTVVISPTTGIVTYTPNPSVSGVDVFTYSVDDTQGNTTTASITVTIEVAVALFVDENDPTGGSVSDQVQAIVSAGGYIAVKDAGGTAIAIIGPATGADGVQYNGTLPQFEDPVAWGTSVGRPVNPDFTFADPGVDVELCLKAVQIEEGRAATAFTPGGMTSLKLFNIPAGTLTNFSFTPQTPELEYQFDAVATPALSPTLSSPDSSNDVDIEFTMSEYAPNVGNISTASGFRPEVTIASVTFSDFGLNTPTVNGFTQTVEVMNPAVHASFLLYGGDGVVEQMVLENAGNPNRWIFNNAGGTNQGITIQFDPRNGPLLVRINHEDPISIRMSANTTVPAELRTICGETVSIHARSSATQAIITRTAAQFLATPAIDLSERHYNQVPLVGGLPGSISKLQSILADASTNAKHVLNFGDSQETSEGFGRTFIPVLNRDLSAAKGLSTTDLIAAGSNQNNVINGRFLHSVGIAGGTFVEDVTTPPGYRFYDTGNSNGVGVLIHEDGDNNQATIGQVSLDTSNLTLEIFARKKTGGADEITTVIHDRPAGTTTVNFFNDIVSTVVSSGLQMSADDTTWVKHTVTIPAISGRLQVVVRGGTIGGMRLVDNNSNGGFAVSSFAAGGLRAGGSTSSSMLSQTENIDAYVAATGPWDASMITLGANDWQTDSPATFKASMLALIDRIRVFHNDPEHLIVIVGETKQFTPPNAQFMEDQYSVSDAIAYEQENVVALNLGLETDFLDQPTHYTDIIHLNDVGAELRAEILAARLLAL